MFFRFLVAFAFAGSAACAGSEQLAANLGDQADLDDGAQPAEGRGIDRPSFCSDECAAPAIFPGSAPDDDIEVPAGTPSADGGLSLEGGACTSAQPVISRTAARPCAIFEFALDGGIRSEARFDSSERPTLKREWRADGGVIHTTWSYDDRGPHTSLEYVNGQFARGEWWIRGDAGELRSHRQSFVAPVYSHGWSDDQYFYDGGQLERIDYRFGPSASVWISDRYTYDGGTMLGYTRKWSDGSEGGGGQFTWLPDGGMKSRETEHYGFDGSTWKSVERWSDQGVLRDRSESGRDQTDRSWETWHSYESGFGERTVSTSSQAGCSSFGCGHQNVATRAQFDAFGGERLRWTVTAHTSRSFLTGTETVATHITDVTRTVNACGTAWPMLVETDSDNDGEIDGRRRYSHVQQRLAVNTWTTGAARGAPVTVTRYRCSPP